MTAKKRWFSKIYNDSQKDKKNNSNISWSSSESDPENELVIKKRKTSWIQLPDGTTNKTISEELILEPSTSSRHNFNEIIVTDESPILSQKESPIIWKRGRLLQQIRTKSSNLFETQSSQNIDSQSNSGEVEVPETTHEIVEPTSPLSQHCTIEPCLSQSSQLSQEIVPVLSQIEINSNISLSPNQDSSQIEVESTYSSSKSDPKLILYHKPPPKRKKYKKGSLAQQLQKALNQQKTGLAIWQHELYLNKNVETDGTEEVIEFKIKKEWKEFGCIIMECESEDSLEFLLFIGFNPIPNITFKSDVGYKLLSPFNTKTVCHNFKEIKCVFNVTKFIVSS